MKRAVSLLGFCIFTALQIGAAQKEYPLQVRDEFKAFQENRRTAQGASPVPALSASKTKLTMLSDPDGADIEIDGKCVGSTPSVLEWPVGEHSVCIKKPSYKEWTRKMTLAAGEEAAN